MRRGRDSNPRYPKGITVFETAAFDHSATSPIAMWNRPLWADCRRVMYANSDRCKAVCPVLVSARTDVKYPLSRSRRAELPLVDQFLLMINQLTHQAVARANQLKHQERADDKPGRRIELAGQIEIDIAVNRN